MRPKEMRVGGNGRWRRHGGEEVKDGVVIAVLEISTGQWQWAYL